MNDIQQQEEEGSLTETPHGLSNEQILRYSRHVILPQLGVHGQQKICQSSVLVVGCGGLGCPVALYLAGSGVGTLGLVDFDTVDSSNLHRQIAHSEHNVGMHKALSLKHSCQQLNSTIQVNVYKEGLNASNALQIACEYDIIVDASDNAPTRYLVSDVCVVSGKPLVSGAAIGLYGQLTIYNYTSDSPCYRCLHPESPAAENCQRCNDAGVLGVVPGIIGSLQALETIKIICGLGDVMDRKLLIFDALTLQFRQVKLRDRNLKCVTCGDNPKITAQNLTSYDYCQFTGQQMNDNDDLQLKILPESSRIDAASLNQQLQGVKNSNNLNQANQIILDVRPKGQFQIGHIKGSINFPIGLFQRKICEVQQLIQDKNEDKKDELEVVIVCKRGNDSQLAVQQLEKCNIKGIILKDLKGGLDAWAIQVDSTMPRY
eukprot:TRINITY_DN17746_c1_g2_i3.p1 TRINITY_DN17746_c1_g2~~TRINITY_DN17746_c1_g2_i3.p1  ORF type:complete len:457 (-),score=53.90 TRINITY_DN17746_c1_g2_i3:862-2151(-)